jgi:4,5-dihydroxyphthalate decarboxylase
MGKLRLSLALSGYDHTRDLLNGVVHVPGIEFVSIERSIEEIFYRVATYRDFDVAEFSFAKYVAMRAAGVTDILALPVFPSRLFRQSSVYLRADSPLQQPEELRGKRVGIPEWAQTASVWSRSWLQHQVGIGLDEIEWVQAGVSEPGRKEKVTLTIPEGVHYRSEPDRDLTSMLLDGTLDAVLSAHPLPPFQRGTGEVVQLFRDGGRRAEEAYHRETGLYPIMHTVVVRTVLLEQDQWIAGTLLAAFEEAKRNSLTRLADINASRFPIPWVRDYLGQVQEQFGDDPFPYGVEANRRSLEAFVGFCHEQGVIDTELEIEELFAPTTLSAFRL